MEKEKLSPFVREIIDALEKKQKIFVMLAPSYIIDFEYPDVIVTLRQMGFDKICEVTFGASMINKCYHEIIKQNPDRLFISSACPVVTMMIKTRYPQYAENLVPVVSPMPATARVVKKYYPEHKILFISPCPAKREEAKVYGNLIDYVLTYRELKDLVDYAKENDMLEDKEVSELFDKFYSKETKIYPLSGGLTKSMHSQDILKEDEVIIMEGVQELTKLFNEGIPKNIRFMDILFCKGGCIGGPGVMTKETTKEKHEEVMDCFEFVKKTEVGEGTILVEDVKGVPCNTPEEYVSNTYYCGCDK